MNKRFTRFAAGSLSLLLLGAVISLSPATPASAVPAPVGASTYSTALPRPVAEAPAAAVSVWTIKKPAKGVSHKARIVSRAAKVPRPILTFAVCVLDRESGGNLSDRQSGVRARNPESSAQGRWQFLNNDWQHSLPWHVRDRLVQFGMSLHDANKIRKFLDKRPIYKWNGWYQDIGFIETAYDRDGMKHWNGHGC